MKSQLILLGVVLSLLVGLTKSEVSLPTKIKRINKAVAKAGGPSHKTPLDNDLFALIYNQERNFSSFIVFTALDPRHKCNPCSEFKQELDLITAAWGRVHKPNELYIFEADYSEKSAVAFQTLRLTQVPFIAYFPPTSGPLAPKGKSLKDYEPYDVNLRGTEAQEFAKFIEKHTGVKLSISRPINYVLVGGILVVTLVTIFLLRLFSDVFWDVFSSKGTWLAVSLGASIFFCAGYMWNQIRGPEFAGVKNGKPELFAPGFQNQYVVESQIMAVLYALTAVVFVALTSKVPTIKNTEYQRIAIFVVLIVFLGLYSMCLKMFRVKNGGYPYKLLL